MTYAQLRPYIDNEVKVLMEGVKLNDHIMAQSFSPGGIYSAVNRVTVNRDFGADSVRFIFALKQTVSSKFHPVGCDTIRSVLDHEIGHQLDNLLDIRSISKIQRLFDSRNHEELTKEISTYSWDNGNPNRYS